MLKFHQQIFYLVISSVQGMVTKLIKVQSWSLHAYSPMLYVDTDLLFLAFMGVARAQPARSQEGHYGHDEFHNWYRTLKDWKGRSFCERGDCRPTQSRVRNGRLEVLVDGECTRVPPHEVYFRKPAQTCRHMSAVLARTVSIHADLSSALFSDQASDWLKDEPVSDVGRMLMVRLVQLDGPVAFDSHAEARADIGIVVPDREVLYAAVVPERH